MRGLVINPDFDGVSGGHIALTFYRKDQINAALLQGAEALERIERARDVAADHQRRVYALGACAAAMLAKLNGVG